MNLKINFMDTCKRDKYTYFIAKMTLTYATTNNDKGNNDLFLLLLSLRSDFNLKQKTRNNCILFLIFRFTWMHKIYKFSNNGKWREKKTFFNFMAYHKTKEHFSNRKTQNKTELANEGWKY